MLEYRKISIRKDTCWTDSLIKRWTKHSVIDPEEISRSTEIPHLLRFARESSRQPYLSNTNLVDDVVQQQTVYDNTYRHPHLQNRKRPIIYSDILRLHLQIHFQQIEMYRKPFKLFGHLGCELPWHCQPGNGIAIYKILIVFQRVNVIWLHQYKPQISWSDRHTSVMYDL